MSASHPLPRNDAIRSVAAAIFSIGALGTTIGLTLPLLSLGLEAQGYSSTLIGLNTMAQFAGILLFSLVVPRLIARRSVVFLMLASIATAAITIAAMPFFSSFAGWMILRFVLGCAEGVMFIVGETWINEVTDDRVRGRVIGLYGTILATGFALGPVIIELTGTSGAMPFVTGALISLCSIIPIIVAADVTPSIAGRSEQPVRGLIGRMPIAVAAAFTFGILDAGAIGLLPIYGLRIGLDEVHAARLVAILVLGGIALQMPLGWLADRIDRESLIMTCAAISAICAFFMPAASGTAYALYAILFMIGGMGVALWTLAMVMMGQHFRGADLAAMNVVMTVSYGLGSMIGPAAYGAAMGIWIPQGLALAMVVSFIGFLAVAFVLPRARGAIDDA